MRLHEKDVYTDRGETPSPRQSRSSPALPSSRPAVGRRQHASSAAGAEVAPASAPVFISVNTDFEGDQIATFRTLLDKFPGSDGLLRMALAELEQDDVDFEQDVKPALGPELDIVVLDLGQGADAPDPEVVALLQPGDPRSSTRFWRRTPAGTPTVKEEVDGWTVLADSQASIDRFKEMRSSGGTLSDSGRFADAMEGLPDDALARAYVNADAIVEAYRVAAPARRRTGLRSAVPERRPLGWRHGQRRGGRASPPGHGQDDPADRHVRGFAS